MLFSEGRGRKVISTENAGQVGQVDEFVIDFASHRVAALLLSKTDGKAKLLPWQGLTAFGTDAVTVPNEGVLVETDPDLDEMVNKHHAVLGKRILNTSGLQIGTARDVDFDPATGQIAEIVTDDARITGEQLLGSGSYAVIVKA